MTDTARPACCFLHRAFRHLVIGMDVPLARIEQPFIERLIAEHGDGLAPSTIRRQILTPISDVIQHSMCRTFASWVRRFGEADTRALLDTRRWKSEVIANRYMQIDALGSTRALVEKLPKIA